MSDYILLGCIAVLIILSRLQVAQAERQRKLIDRLLKVNEELLVINREFSEKMR